MNPNLVTWHSLFHHSEEGLNDANYIAIDLCYQIAEKVEQAGGEIRVSCTWSRDPAVMVLKLPEGVDPHTFLEDRMVFLAPEA